MTASPSIMPHDLPETLAPDWHVPTAMRQHPAPTVDISDDLGDGEMPPAPLRNTCEIRWGDWRLRQRAHRPVLPPRGRHYSTGQSSGAPRAPFLWGSVATAPLRAPSPGSPPHHHDAKTISLHIASRP